MPFRKDTVPRYTETAEFDTQMLATPLIWDVALQWDALNFLSSFLLLRLDGVAHTGLISFCGYGPDILDFNWFQHWNL